MQLGWWGGLPGLCTFTVLHVLFTAAALLLLPNRKLWAGNRQDT